MSNILRLQGTTKVGSRQHFVLLKGQNIFLSDIVQHMALHLTDKIGSRVDYGA